jgi:hypothetical protein
MATETLTQIGLMLIDLNEIEALFPHQRDYFGVIDSVGTVYFKSGKDLRVPKDVYLVLYEKLLERVRVQP